MQEPMISPAADVAPDLSGETPAVFLSSAARPRAEAALSEAARTSLHPFLPCEPEEAGREDYLSAAQVLFRNLVEQEPAPYVTPLLHEIKIPTIGSLTCIEPVIEILETTAEWAEMVTPEVGELLRTAAEQELSKKYSREVADRLATRYLDPAPPGEAPYGEDGILRSVDLSERRVVPWLAEGMIQAGTVGLWVAPFSSGKTFGAIALGLALAFERKWMDTETNGGGHVRYVAAEGLASFDKRLAGWLVRNELLPERFSRQELSDVLDGRFDLSGGGLRLDDPRLEEVLVQTIQEDGTQFLVLDTLGRLLGVGQSDEDNSVANSIMGVLHRVAAVTGCTILVVHHPGHTQTHRARGASAWQQAADWVLVSKGNLKSARPVRLVNTKQRDAELFADVAYRLRPVGGVECDGEPWSSAVFEPADVEETTDLPLRDRILLDVQAHPGSSLREVRARVKGDNTDIGDETIRMLSDGVLKDKGSGNGYKLHENPGRDEFEADAEAVGNLSDLTQEGAANE